MPDKIISKLSRVVRKSERQVASVSTAIRYLIIRRTDFFEWLIQSDLFSHTWDRGLLFSVYLSPQHEMSFLGEEIGPYLTHLGILRVEYLILRDHSVSVRWVEEGMSEWWTKIRGWQERSGEALSWPQYLPCSSPSLNCPFLCVSQLWLQPDLLIELTLLKHITVYVSYMSTRWLCS